MPTKSFTPEWLESHRVDVSTLEPDELIGVGHVQTELRSLLGRLKHPDLVAAVGAELPRAVLLYGPPGVGKTLFGRVLGRQLGDDVPFFEISADELTPDRVRGTFPYLAAQYARSVLYLDEIQIFAMTDPDVGSRQGRAVLAALLAGLSGIRSTPGPIVIAATTAHPDEIAPALLRAGRLGLKIRFGLPDTAEREALLRRFAEGKAIEPEIDWARAAEASARYSPADLRQVIDDALGLALADDRRAMADRDLRSAIHRDGLIEPVLAEAPRRRTAIHESGHVAVAWALLGTGSVKRVSVSNSGGTTLVGDEDQPHSALSREELLARVATLYAGGVAERILLDEGSLSSLQDRIDATNLLLEMADAGLIAGVPVLSRSAFGHTSPAALDDQVIAAIAPVAERALEQAREIVAREGAGIERFSDILLAVGGEMAGKELDDAIDEAFLPAWLKP